MDRCSERARVTDTSKGVDVLIELTFDHLIEEGFSEDNAAQIMEDLEAQLDEIEIRVTYSDILGNVIADNERID